MAAAAVALTAAAILLGARSLTYTRWYQNRRYARMPLERLATEARTQPGNPIVLYYYGKALDKQGRFTQALVPLEHAAGLDPDDARVRGEWSTAQLAGGYITGAFGQLTQFARTHPNSAEGHMLLGRLYVAQNSCLRATEELEQAVRIDPDLGEAWSMLAGARLQMGSMIPARDAARRAVALRPNSAVDHLLLASLLLTTDDPSGARQEYARAAALAPNNPDYLNQYARILLKGGDAGDVALAQKVARRAIALDPRASDAYYNLGRALALQGKTAAAIEPLQTAASMLPPGTPRSTLAANAPEQFLAPVPALELARAYRALGNVKVANSWEQQYVRREQMAEEDRRLQDAIQNHPDQKEAHRQRALFLARRGDVEGVAQDLAKVMNSAPDAPMVLVVTANALTEAGYGEMAALLARRAAAFSKNSPAVYEAWGNALMAMDQPHEAAVKYAVASGWRTDKLPIYRRKIAEYYRQRQLHPSKAEKLYEQAVALEHSSMGAIFNAGKVQALLARAVVLEPRNTDYRRYLLRVLMGRHEPAEAEQAARELLALSPEDGLAHATLAVILLQKANSEHDLSEVEAHLTSAERAGEWESSVLPTVHYGQGILALRRGQAREAVRLLRLAADEDPSADAAYYQLAQAQRMAGNTAEAVKTQEELTRREDRRRQELDLLTRIAAKPDDRLRYVETIRFYDRNGMKAQAAAVAASMRQRFRGE